jgi:hypothetical protein
MRIISEAYQHLGNKLLTEVLDKKKRAAFHWADLWYEQTDFPELAEAIDYPAIFFDFAADTVSTIGQMEQDVQLNTDIYVAVDTIQDTAINSPEHGDGLHYFDLCARVHELLQAHEHPSCGNLNRIGFSRYSARTNVVVYRMTYQSQVVDTSPTDIRLPVEPGPGAGTPPPPFNIKLR